MLMFDMCSGSRVLQRKNDSGHAVPLVLAARTQPLSGIQVWSITPLPDGTGFVSASADKFVKLWKWSRVETEGAAARLSAEEDKAINTEQDVLCAKVSPDGNLLAVSLISNVIKVSCACCLQQ